MVKQFTKINSYNETYNEMYNDAVDEITRLTIDRDGWKDEAEKIAQGSQENAEEIRRVNNENNALRVKLAEYESAKPITAGYIKMKQEIDDLRAKLARITKLIDELKSLHLPVDEFAVFGSGPMAIRGMREPNDLDVIVSKRLWMKLLATNTVTDKKTYHFVRIGNIEFFENTCPERDIDRLIHTADMIDGIRYVNLDEILSWKRQRNTDKDKADIQLIESYRKSK